MYVSAECVLAPHCQFLERNIPTSTEKHKFRVAEGLRHVRIARIEGACGEKQLPVRVNAPEHHVNPFPSSLLSQQFNENVVQVSLSDGLLVVVLPEKCGTKWIKLCESRGVE